MDWLRRHTRDPKTKLGRPILATHTALTWPEKKWRYVGYKGGSEPGALSMTWLLEDVSGRWKVLTVTWNHATKLLDDAKLEELAQGVVLLLER